MEKITLSNDPIIHYTELAGVTHPQGVERECRLSEWFTRLQQFTRTPETAAQYAAATATQRSLWKDVGGFVAAQFTGNYRDGERYIRGYAVTLDLEKMYERTGVHVSQEDLNAAVMGLGYCVAYYSSHSSTPEAPRGRAVFPLLTPQPKDVVELISRDLARQLNMKWVDPASFSPAQLMFYPSCSIDADPIFWYQDGPLLDPAQIQARYTILYGDWQLRKHWPTSDSERLSAVKKAPDPRDKPGVIGAYNRAYDIFRTLDEIIPGVYSYTTEPNRLAYSRGSGADGAVVYEDYGYPCFLFSHHESDPAHGNNHSFDLMRVHLFGHLDNGLPADTPMSSRPSYREACAFAETLPDVAAELARERQEQAISDFSGIGEPVTTPDTNAPDDTDVTCLEDVEEREPEWLIQGYIPKGEITVLAGDGGTGKTFVWCNIAAAISSGSICFMLNNLFQEHPQQNPQKVMYFSAEDSNEAVLRPRLRENGAVLKNIVTLDSTDERFQNVKLDSAFLERLIAKHRPVLCIFDPLQAFLPRGVNMIARNDMRQAMSKLHVYGEKYGTTFLIIMHTNKKSDVSGRSRLADSADIWDIARSVLIAGKTDATGTTRYVSHEKSSYGKEGQTVLFRIAGKNAVEFASYSDKHDRDFVQAAAKESRTAPTKEACEQFIIDYLTDHGKVPMNELDEAAKVYYATHTVRDAKASLKAAEKIVIHAAGEGNKKGVKWLISLGT